MQKTEELLLNSFGKTWLKSVNVKWKTMQKNLNPTLIPCVYVYIYMHTSIYEKVQVYIFF